MHDPVILWRDKIRPITYVMVTWSGSYISLAILEYDFGDYVIWSCMWSCDYGHMTTVSMRFIKSLMVT